MNTPRDQPDGPSPPPTKPLRAKGYRSPHRSRSHKEAHDDAAAGSDTLPTIPEHPLIPRGEPELITSPGELTALLNELRDLKSFAFDTEFIGEQSYFPQLCLIQVATPAKVLLIDPLAELDLKPFWELVADPSVEKIVHAGEQDLEPVMRHIGKPAADVFDTQIAAGFVGLTYPMALSKLVAAIVGADVGHGTKFSQWDHRPLSAAQRRYAANDVRYLPAARAELARRLEENGNLAWALDECAAEAQVAAVGTDPKAQRVRVRGVSSLGPRQQSVLRALLAWRDAVARAKDLPPRTLLRDDVIMEMSRRPAKSVDDLTSVRGLPRPVEREFGATLVEVTAQALKADPIELPPRRPDETPEEKQRADAVWLAVQECCRARSIDPPVATSRKEVARVVRRLAEGKSMGDSPLAAGWRLDLLGDTIQRAATAG